MKGIGSFALLVSLWAISGCSDTREYALKQPLVIQYSAPGEPTMQATVPAGAIASITTRNGAITSINIMP